MEILHDKFKKEYPDIKISYSEFCKNRPFWIIKPTVTDRDSCLCKTHANLQFMADKLAQHKMIPTRKIEDLAISLCCSPWECAECAVKELATSTFDPGAQTSWYVWKAKAEEREKKRKDGSQEKFTVHLTVKEKAEGTLQSLLEDFSAGVKDKLGKHVYNIRHQYAAIRGLKETLREDELVLHVDLAENFQCKYSSEVQAVHFGDSHHQVSLHTGVAYTCREVKSICSISPSYRHDPSAIWAHLTPVLIYLIEKYPEATTLHVVSDGPTTQYRSKKNFFLLTNVPYQMGWKRVTWNVLEAGHGKGPADGIGAAVKRRADDIIARGRDIPNARVLFDELKQKSTSTELFYVEPNTIEEMDVHVPAGLQSIRGTMKIHQIISHDPSQMSWRVLSCFCSAPNTCNCFTLETVRFQPWDDSTPSTSALPEGTSIDGGLQAILDLHDGRIGQWCAVVYDGDVYPGIIQDVDLYSGAEVKTMTSIGRNLFFWPLRDDTWYQPMDIIGLIPEPVPVTKRHKEIKMAVWNKICEVWP
ncbi:hypothetical protein ACEWY4_018225 [Coilia grayii]|uniref:Uncharacterized protein n=1 Tax=Coilia grayii TaxID=363190 RepID=A0ABD1JKC1_9TELE